MAQSSSPGEYHISWFSNGDLHQGIYYGRYSFAHQSTRDLIQVDGAAGSGHPHLTQNSHNVYLVWKAFDGEKTAIKMIKSSNNGNSWSTAQTLFTTSQASDYPMLLRHADAVYLSWHSDEHGYVIDKLDKSNGIRE